MSTVAKAHQNGFIRHYFRVQRIILTPIVRGLLFRILPVTLCAGAVVFYLDSGGKLDRLTAEIAAIAHRFADRPANQVNGLRIVASSERLHSDLAARIELQFPRSILSIDLDDIRRRAEEFPEVRSAAVTAEPGGLLTIALAERAPAVIFRRGDSLVLLDANGSELTGAVSRADHMPLPLIVGEGAERSVPEALRIFAAAAGIRDSIRGLNRVGERRWDLVLDRGRRVLLPEDGSEEAIQRLIILDNAEFLLQRQLAVVDLRDPQRTSVRLSEAAAERSGV